MATKKIVFIIGLLLAASYTMPTSAQEKTAAEKIDSILAVLPQLKDSEKDNAFQLLSDLAIGMPEKRYYTRMYIDFARRQKNYKIEGAALQRIAETYFTQWDTDSLFISADEAIRFAQKHRMYDLLSNLRVIVIRRYVAQGQTLTALRMAEEAYEEAKTRQDHASKATILQTLGSIHFNLSQYEEATRFYLNAKRMLDHSDLTI